MYYKIFNKIIEVAPDSIAVISDNRTLTYLQFIEETEKLSLHLASLGVKRGSHIAILSENNIDFIILVFALWNIQAVPVPINIRLLDEEIERLIEHSKAEFIFVHKKIKGRLDKKKKKIFPLKVSYNFFDSGNKSGYYFDSANDPDPESVALILYTSGTTGSSKGVMLTYNNLLQSASSADNLIGFSSEDKWLSSLPFYHIGGLSIPIRAFLYGSKLIVSESLKAESIKKALLKFDPTLTSFVSATLQQLLDSGTKPNPRLRLVLLGGGPIDDELANRAINEGWEIAKVYGSTETSSLVTFVLLNDFPDKISSAGKPLLSNKIFIIDENGNCLKENQTGEIVVSGQSVMKGYWKNPEQTEAKLKLNKYYSGDLGYLDNEGYLFISSRRTDLIVSGGENINPLEIEEAILKYPGIKEACVFPLKDIKWGQTAAAAIISINKDLNAEELTKFLREKLSPFKIPKKIFITDELPKTSLGKIKREEVRQRYEEPTLYNSK